MQTLLILTGIILAAVACRLLHSRHGRYVLLAGAFALGIVAFELARQSHHQYQRSVIMANEEDAAKRRYDHAQ